ncbi:MAG: bifunctional folylpolyglutamate synthase/dihydrofolate synthase [Pedosphaera sp.]|nr:bifunctional folylpolyglutamate synthase/dihydrofolate synthase [Pedosphaera sp.]
MTYAQAIQFLHSLGLFGARFGLETTRSLAARVGNPQDRLRFIHVAGTNGKGSTCAMLESIYRAAGLRVGLFTSPHLVSFRERIQVNRELISEADVVRLVAEIVASPAKHPTLFEFVTVMALKYFAEQKCHLVIWETGLGGRLDATNIVTPLASVITNIGLDHQQWLGDTLEKIAAEKAGIIKSGVPVLTAADQPEVLNVFERVAREQGAPLTIVAADGNPPPTATAERIAALCRDAATLPLPGEHQRLNAALAAATVKVLQSQIPVSDAQIRGGLAQVDWPGRLQLITRPDGGKILLDGAHNVAGAEVLRAALRGAPSTASARFKKQSQLAETVLGAPTLILGVLADKDWRTICEILAPLAARILLVPVGSERTAKPDELAEVCRRANPPATVLTCASLPEAMQRTAGDPFVVITGSLYLVGEALELLGLNPEHAANERALNEWGAARR